MKLSIIIPVYNGEKYVVECLDSVTKGISSDVEIVVVDDGSNDKTREIVSNYIDEHGQYNIKFIVIENGGVSRARHIGVQNGCGEYIGFMDADDWIEENYFSDMLDRAVEEDADIVCAGCTVDYENKKKFLQNDTCESVCTGKEALKYLHEKTAIFPFMWNKIYKKKILKKVEFPYENIIGEDYMVTQQVLQLASKICIVENKGYHWMQNSNSLSHGGYNDGHRIAFEKYKQIVLNLQKKYPEYKNIINNYVNAEYIAIITAMEKNGIYNKKMIKEIIAITRKNLWNMLRDKNSSLFTKCVAIATAINYRVLILVYKVREHKLKISTR